MRILTIVLILFFPIISKANITTTYKARNSKHTDFYQIYNIENKLPDGSTTINLKFTEAGNLNREHIVTLDSNFSTIRWKFTSPITHLSIDAYRKDNKIILKGTKNGKVTEKEFDIGANPWFQIFPTGLSSFAQSSKESQVFVSIGVEGQGEMEIGEFIAKHAGLEKVKNQDAETLSITFNNWKSTFWKGKSWHRKSDGRVLGIEVGRDIGTWELEAEKSNN
jgi:hypothetical protein